MIQGKIIEISRRRSERRKGYERKKKLFRDKKSVGLYDEAVLKRENMANIEIKNLQETCEAKYLLKNTRKQIKPMNQ